MDLMNYYTQVFSNALKVLVPYFIFIVGGYFVFFKLPFLFLRKSMEHQKKKILEEEQLKVLEIKSQEAKVKEPQIEMVKEKKKEKPDSQQEGKKKQEQQFKRESKKEEPKKTPSISEPSPEEVFNYSPHDVITKNELKKRYFELLRQNHPDRVASMGQDFKKLAEKNTKEINKAYDKLKRKAS